MASTTPPIRLPTAPDEPPPWSQPGPAGNSSRSVSDTNRLGRRYSLGRSPSSRSGVRGQLAQGSEMLASLAASVRTAADHAAGYFVRLPPLQRVFVALGMAAGFCAGVLLLTYSHRIFAWLGPVAKGWHDLRGGWVLVWLLIFASAFPPIIGYSTACTTAGIVYGFPWGWPLAATASVAGSLVSFLASRGVLSRYVDRLVGDDRRFVALGHVLRQDGLWVLAAVRFCPLPYSLSNGFLATIPSITPLSFALSTAMASPKLIVHVFIGSRIAKLAEEGDSMSVGDKAVNYISMMIFGLFGVGIGLLVFRRTMARAAELDAGEGAEEGRAGLTTGEDGPYADSDNGELLNPDDVDVAALMDEDDISLWATDQFADSDGADSSTAAEGQGNSGRAATYRDGDSEPAKAPASRKQ
ncbi:tlg2-vesicle protein of [Grosmannia clavigera kw1407]|uniref:Golgi apparatus membrane protein TVP38 n=1 Tax=Grosmannia clavigera (strain kw1407 / UAMH 11150) TaxID=655863 RepID=F0XS32_GROCL|nr:tlg2-vesicle protein of [Grosmannia clavigera kw1407]EFW99556.1 tlg2-vesicle protein of [Grosmannia clavigera kw1407]